MSTWIGASDDESHMQTPTSGSPPVSQVLTDIVRNLQEIARAEIRLARYELRDELRSTLSASLLFVGGAICGFLSAFFVLVSLVVALSRRLPWWAANLSVGLTLAIFAVIILSLGARRFRHPAQRMPKAVSGAKETGYTNIGGGSGASG
jgi:uncharacterized membrane protein YqjE